MRNVIGQAVIGDDLYGREFELARIRERPDQDEHLLMLAPRRRSAGQPLERLKSGVLTRCTSDTSLPDTFQHMQQCDRSSGRDGRRVRSRGALASALRRDISFESPRPDQKLGIDIQGKLFNRSRRLRPALPRAAGDSTSRIARLSRTPFRARRCGAAPRPRCAHCGRTSNPVRQREPELP